MTKANLLLLQVYFGTLRITPFSSFAYELWYGQKLVEMIYNILTLTCQLVEQKMSEIWICQRTLDWNVDRYAVYMTKVHANAPNTLLASKQSQIWKSESHGVASFSFIMSTQWQHDKLSWGTMYVGLYKYTEVIVKNSADRFTILVR